MTPSSPGSRPIDPISWLNFNWILGYNTRLFRDFERLSSVPGSKIMANKTQINQGNPWNLPSKFLKYLDFFGVTLEPKMLESQSTARKTSIIA